MQTYIYIYVFEMRKIRGQKRDEFSNDNHERERERECMREDENFQRMHARYDTVEPEVIAQCARRAQGR